MEDYNTGGGSDNKDKPFDTDSYFNTANVLDDPKSITFPRVLLSELLSKEKREENVKILTTAFNEYGFCFVNLEKDNEIYRAFRDSRKCSKVFFDTESKVNSTMTKERDIGYHDFTTVKEFFQMRYSESDDYPWPKEPSNFKEISKNFYLKMMSLCRIVLSALAEGLETKPENLTTKMLDEDNFDDKSFYSSSIYRFFRYRMLESAMTEPCQVHTDIGMLTIIPCSSSPSLQMLHPRQFSWIDIERWANKRDAIVFCGETLERISAYYFRAVIHRVVRNFPNPRYSEVFLLRARPDSWIDTEGLKSKVIGELYWDMKKKVSMLDYMKKQYATKKSANFINESQGAPLVNITGETKNEEGEMEDEMPEEEKDDYPQIISVTKIDDEKKDVEEIKIEQNK